MLTTVPGAIWSGAIAPSLNTRRVQATLRIPSYPANLSTIFEAPDTQNAHGDFSFDPTRFTTTLVTNGQQASNHNVSQPEQTPHNKLDNSNYVYLTRSFGVGSLVGLVDPSIDAVPVTYTYVEPGIVAHLSLGGGWFGTVGSTTGNLLNGDTVMGAWLIGVIFQDLFAIDKVYEQDLRQGQIIMAGGYGNSSYWHQGQFNNVQCLLTFASHDIQVKVDVGRKTILTDVLGETAWPAYGDNITSQSMSAFREMSATDNAFAGSRVVRALWVNAVQLRYLTTGNSSGDDIPENIIMQSVSDFTVSVFENTLVAIGACRVQCAQATQEVTADVEIRSFVFGAPRFMYIVLLFNFVLVSVATYMVLVRKVWTRTVQLDFTDMVDVALNASRGGTDLYNQFAHHSSWSDAKFALEHVRWRWPAIVAANTASMLNIDTPFTDTTHTKSMGSRTWTHDVGLLSSAQSSVYR